MKRLLFLFTFVVLPILFMTCEKPDEEAPTVTILNIQENDVVYEIVTISCVATDNEAVEKVELWLDGEYSGISDSSEPFKLEWNTMEYENRKYVVTVRVYDVNGNKSDSDPLNITVNNNLAVPTAVNVTSVSYTLTSMTINWDKSQDSDFASYTLLYSQSQNGNKSVVTTFNDINAISHSLNEFDPTHENWFWIRVTDTFGYSSTGNGQSNPIDSPPTYTELYTIEYDNDSFIITWSQNNDDDFAFYTLYESYSEDMSDQTEIFKSNINTETSIVVNDVNNEYRYYQTVVEDDWGLQSISNIQKGIPYVIFVKSFDRGSSNIYGRSVQQTDDDGYIITGYTHPYSDGQVLLIKTDSQGIEEWNQTFSSNYARGYSVQQTDDGGYIIAGRTGSIFVNDGDVLLIKTDSQGIEEWSQTFGGSEYEIGYSVQQTDDGGFIITGYTWSYGNGAYDVWLIKTNSQGVEEWNQTFGGNNEDSGNSVQQTDDGGFIITGFTNSFGSGNYDVWLIKTNAQGNEEWNQTFGGGGDDRGNSVQQTDDGGFIITGFTHSFGNGNADVWLIKTNSQGIEEWNQTVGGTQWEEGNSVQQTDDGGYIFTGSTNSTTGKANIFLLKTDPKGDAVPYNW